MQGEMPCCASILRILSLSYPLPPTHHCGGRRQVPQQHSSASEVTPALSSGANAGDNTLLSQTTWSLLVMSPLIRLIKPVSAPLIEAGGGAMGFDVCQWRQSSAPLALWDQVALWGQILSTWKRSCQRHCCLTNSGNGRKVFCGIHRQLGHPHTASHSGSMDDAAQHLPAIHPLHTLFPGEGGADTCNLLFVQPKQLSHHSSS